MKKVLLACLFTFAAAQTYAQVTFSPGVRAGVNFSYFTEGDSFDDYEEADTEYTAKTDFYVGFYGALKLSRVYTLQPEVTYSRQGSVIEVSDSDFGPGFKETVDISYLSLALVNKFTFRNFNVHLAPTLDFVVQRPEQNDLLMYYGELESDVDFGISAGFGYNFTKSLGVEARIKKGIVPVIDNGEYHTNVNFSIGATYTFDVSAKEE